jgi:hypothetical protein
MEKARFDVENSGFFEVQYNPEKFQVDRATTWHEASEQGKKSGLEYQKTAPAMLSMELIFDTSIEGSDVRTTWINRMVDTLDPHVTITMEQGAGQGVPEAKVRPPKVTFSWGNFTMEGVIESLTTSYILFSETGTPIRAKVSVKMKEFLHTRQIPMGGSMSSYSLPRVQVVQVQQGQTLSMLAGAFGTSAQMLADMNGISNPLELAAGTMLKIPGA